MAGRRVQSSWLPSPPIAARTSDLALLMSIELTEQQQQTLHAFGKTPVRVIDPRTSNAYMFIQAAEYEAVREVLEDERQQRAIRAVEPRNAAGRLGDQP
jgi:hypothetical protein